MTFIFDGVQWLRADQVDAIQETVVEKATDRYAVEPRKVSEFTRHVTMRSGKEFSSPGEAAELATMVSEHLDDMDGELFDAVPPMLRPGPGTEDS
jgi:hypothetical protein